MDGFGVSSVENLYPQVVMDLVDVSSGCQCPSALKVQLQIAADTVAEQAWAQVLTRLTTYLSMQDISSVEIEQASELPMQDPATGKFYHVRVQMDIPVSVLSSAIVRHCRRINFLLLLNDRQTDRQICFP